MSERIWHKGPPPHRGWWNASVIKDPDAWRWWNGKGWSHVVFPWYGLRVVLASAAILVPNEGAYANIQWTTYWPENARVPRVDPRKPARFERIPDYPEAVLGHLAPCAATSPPRWATRSTCRRSC